jgi:hypothetical protein
MASAARMPAIGREGAGDGVTPRITFPGLLIGSRCASHGCMLPLHPSRGPVGARSRLTCSSSLSACSRVNDLLRSNISAKHSTVDQCRCTIFQTLWGANHAVNDGSFEQLAAGSYHHPSESSQPAPILQSAQKSIYIHAVRNV